MATVELPDEQWSKILQFLHGCPDVYVGQETDCRSFIEGVLWVARSGAQWRFLPEKYGKWNCAAGASQKGRSRGAGPGPEPRRGPHQSPPERGCLGQSVALQADWRPKP